MNKKLLSLLLIIFVLSTSMTTITLSQSNYDMVLLIGDPNALLNGKQTKIDSNNDSIVPFVTDGRTLVPLRFVAESFGADVGFEDETQLITISIDGKVINMQPDNITYKVDGEESELDVAPIIFEGRTFVPFRRIAEIIGKYVSYDDGVIILTNSEVDLGTADFIAAKDVLLNGLSAPSVSTGGKLDFNSFPVSLNASSEQSVNPLSFYVGKVQREFGSETKLQTIELGDYITRSEVKSVTGELNLNYSDGYMITNTDKAQGIVGFMASAPKDFQDVRIDSQNEYASIFVTSVDNQPIKSSEKILIQAVTEEKVLGFETQIVTEARNPSGTSAADQEIVDKKEITNMGADLMQVKEIEATVTLNGITDGYLAALDENGYPKEMLTPNFKDGNLEISIPKDTIYVMYSKSPMAMPSEKAEKVNYVWWEGEDMEHNFPDQLYDWLNSTQNDPPANVGALSNESWLSATGNKEDGLYAEIEINVPEDGEYNLYVRKAWNYGSFKWRVGESDSWKTHESGLPMLETGPNVREHHPVAWSFVDSVSLTGGTHKFRLEVVNNGQSVALDCFILTKETFVPNGKFKPSDSKSGPESGYFAFDPAYDEFTDEAVLDLRFLNEEVAGQDGFISSEGENFVMPNGDKVRFWSVNTSYSVVGNSKTTVDYLAKTIAKRGVNLVRVHGSIFDIVDRKASVKQTEIDNLQYFVYAMKNVGIYVELSIYFPLWHQFGSNTGYPEYDNIDNKNPFMLLQFEPDFQQAYKDVAKHLFETVSPYTNVALKDEPAIAIFEIQNEDNYFFWTFKMGNMPDVYAKQLEKLYGDWLIEKHGSLENALTSWGNQSDPRDDFANGIAGLKDAWNMTSGGLSPAIQKRMQDQVEFLTVNQREFYDDITKYLKNDLGVKSLVAAGNWTTADQRLLEALERYTYEAGDIIDHHGYVEPELHQSLSGTQGHAVRLGDKYIDGSALFKPDRIPLKFVNNAGMPYILSEIGWTNPNRFRAEFPMLMASYASLQGMDAPMFFMLGTSFEKAVGKFSIATPTILGQFPAAALIYRNGYVRETEPVVLETLKIEDLYELKGSFINEDQNLDIFRQN